MVLGLADPGVPGGVGQVGGLVDEDRRVAGADAVRGFARAVRCLDHRGTAGRDRQVAHGHQLLRQRDARSLEAQDEVLRGALLLQGGAKHADDLRAVRLLSGCGEKMTASLHLIALIAMLTIVTSGLVTGSSPAITPAGLAYLTMPPVGKLFDDADALGAERVAQDAQDLPPPGGDPFCAAHAALVHTHPGEPGKGLVVGGRPCDRAAQTVDGRLVVVVHRRHGGSRPVEKLACRRSFLLGDGSSHRHIIPARCSGSYSCDQRTFR